MYQNVVIMEFLTFNRYPREWSSYFITLTMVNLSIALVLAKYTCQRSLQTIYQLFFYGRNVLRHKIMINIVP